MLIIIIAEIPITTQMGRGAIRPIFQAQIGNLDIVICPNVWKTPIDRVA